MKIQNAEDVKSSILPNDDNNRLPPLANRIDVSSLPVLTNPFQLTLLVNVLDPLIIQSYIVLIKLRNVLESIINDNFASTSNIVKQVLATGSYVSSQFAPNGLIHFNLLVQAGDFIHPCHK
ncbi:MAG: hypothetical protein EZS28_048114, partial [Streblomastix strix]